MRLDITGLLSLKETSHLVVEDDRIVFWASSPDGKKQTLVKVRVTRGVFVLESTETI